MKKTPTPKKKAGQLFPAAKDIVDNKFQGGGSQLLTLTEEGDLPPSRIKDASSAHTIYKRYRFSDMESARQRRLVQEMYDCALPYDKDKLKSLGQGHRFNLNFGEAASLKEQATTAYNDLTDSTETMVRVRLKAGYADESEVAEKQGLIADGYHRMLKRWGEFDSTVQRLADVFIGHGVGFAYFPSATNWQFDVTGLQDFLISRQTRATEKAIQVGFAMRRYPVNELYQYVKDPEKAKENGWNREEVLKLIVRTCNGGKSVINYLQHIEEFEAVVKNNDLYAGEGLADTAAVVHCWVQEFDGTVSQYMIDEKGQADDFLFGERSRFDSVNNCFVGFTYGVGNGFYHGIRGQGYKIYSQVQASNRLRCGVLDSIFLSLSLLVQSEDADDLSTLSLVNFGPVTALPPEIKIHPVGNFAPPVQPAMGVVSDLSMQIQRNNGSYVASPVDPNAGRDRVTKAEVVTREESRGALAAAAMNLFYQPWQRLHREIFRRVQNKDYPEDTPGYEEVEEFRQWCEDRGVSIEDIAAVEDVEVVRAIGAGSSSLRRMMLDELMQYVWTLDEVGRNNLLRDKFAQNVGYSMVDRYIPRIQQLRPIVDERFAELENADLRLGQSVKIAMTDVHVVHLGIHIMAMQETLAGLQTTDPNQPPPIDPQHAMQHFGVAVPHCQEHLAAFAQDTTRKQQHAHFAELVNAFAQLSEQLAHNLREQQIAQARMERSVAEAKASQDPNSVGQDGQPLAPGQLSPDVQAKVDAANAIGQARLHQLQEIHDLRMQNSSQAAMQKMALDDLAAARKSMREIGKRTPTAQPQPAPVPSDDSAPYA